MNKELNKIVGTQLKLVRVENDDTIQELASKLNMSGTTIWRYENAKCDMTVSIIVKILDYYKKDIGIFFEEVNAKMHRNEE